MQILSFVKTRLYMSSEMFDACLSSDEWCDAELNSMSWCSTRTYLKKVKNVISEWRTSREEGSAHLSFLKNVAQPSTSRA